MPCARETYPGKRSYCDCCEEKEFEKCTRENTPAELVQQCGEQGVCYGLFSKDRVSYQCWCCKVRVSLKIMFTTKETKQ